MTQLENYRQIKEQYKDALLLFRCGDFYEAYCKDAVECADILGISTTTRDEEDYMIHVAGFPFHSLDAYLPKLVRAGKRIVICDGMEQTSKKKTIEYADHAHYNDYREHLKCITNGLRDMARAAGRGQVEDEQLLRECYNLIDIELHTRDVWECMGYKVRTGQHAYLFWYTNEDVQNEDGFGEVNFMYAKEQVERINK